MQLVIEEQTLQETLWEEDCRDTVFVIPEGVRRLAFCCLDSYDREQEVPDLREVVIPNTVELIEEDAFLGIREFRPLPHLHTVRFRGILEEWCAIEKGTNEDNGWYSGIGISDYDLYLLDKDGGEYLAEHLVIPGDVSEIRTCCFAGCASLKTVDIPGNVSIFCRAFADCRNLSWIRIQGEGLRIEAGDIFEPGDQSPFDEREDLEIQLSDTAAEALIHSEYFDLKNTPVRMTLMDRGETLGEILEIVEFLQEEYHYKYGTPLGQDIIPAFRSYLEIRRREQREENDSYDDESDAEEIPAGADPAERLPGGYHYDDRITLRAQIFHWLIVCYRRILEYQESVRKMAAGMVSVRDAEDAIGLLRGLPNLYHLAEEAEDLMDLIDERSDELIERGVLDVSETICDRIGDIRDGLEEICGMEEDLDDCIGDYMRLDEWDQIRTRDSFREDCRMRAEDILESSENAKQEVWELLRAEHM